MRNAAIAAVLLFLSTPLVAQDAVPVEILQRTLLIKAGNEGATAFAVDYEGKIYLVTARHVVAGLPRTGATIQLGRSDRWEDYHVVRTLLPPSDDVDIAVLETEEKIPKPCLTRSFLPRATRPQVWGSKSGFSAIHGEYAVEFQAVKFTKYPSLSVEDVSH